MTQADQKSMTENAVDLMGHEVERRLMRGAEVCGDPAQAAAVHLLVFIELTGRRVFARHLQLDAYEGEDGTREPIARVRDWQVLATDEGISMHPSSRRLLQMAASLAAHIPVDLGGIVAVDGHGYIRRIVEAMLIAASGDQFYTLQGTAALEQLVAQTTSPYGLW